MGSTSGPPRSASETGNRPTTLPLAGSTRRSNGHSRSADPTPVRRRAQNLTRSVAHDPHAYRPEQHPEKRSLSAECLQRRRRYGVYDGAQAARIGRYLSGSSELLAVDSRSLEELRQTLGSPLHQTLVPHEYNKPEPEAATSSSNYAGERVQEYRCECPGASKLPPFGRQQSAPAEMASLPRSEAHSAARAERAVLMVGTNTFGDEASRVPVGVNARSSDELDERLCVVLGNSVAWAPRAAAINGTVTLL